MARRPTPGLSISTLLLATIAIYPSPGVTQSAVPPVVQTTHGKVEGLHRQAVDVYFGIPFAAPPVGELRLAPPRPAAAWTDTWVAKVPSSACPQLASPDPAGLASNNEDCLYLNVWRRAATGSVSDRPAPVIVWVHGGGFVEGYGAAKQYDGERLAMDAGAVVVTVNYRVGALGFLAASALDDADPHHVSGNYGMQDVQMALRWVRQEVGAFGGDPNNVTVMGESAGANAVLGLLASPKSDGLFQRAVVQSSTDGAHTVPLARAERENYAHALEEIGCDVGPQTLSCLRSTRVEAFLRMTAKPTLVQDGEILPLDPFQAFGAGKFMKVPVLIGSNAKENYLFTARTESDVLKRTIEHRDLAELLKASFGQKADAVLAQYPVAGYSTPSILIASALTDRRFACVANLARSGLSEFVPVYGYQLDIADPVQQQPLMPGSDLPNLSYHTTDLGYVFNNDNEAHALTGRHAALSHAIVGYWSAFVAGGNPNAAEARSPALWPPFTKENPVLLSLSDTPAPKHDFREEHKCDFWEHTGMVSPTW